jgi:glucose/arabinose dehydrogenase
MERDFFKKKTKVVRLAGFLCIFILSACSSFAQTRIPNTNNYYWEEMTGSLGDPVQVTNAGDNSRRLFIVRQRGDIKIFRDGEIQDGQFLDIKMLVSTGREQGLLSLAFHPNYEENGHIFVNYTDLEGNTVVARYQVSENPDRVDHESEEMILQVFQDTEFHNGGQLEFGPDGYLYIGLGDGGPNNDPNGKAQALDHLLGTILRIDVDRNFPYAIPEDNPFASGGGQPEIFAYGLRNPWRFSFDPESGDIYIADVGQFAWEEVNFLPAEALKGANFGWNYFEGNHEYADGMPEDLALVFPIEEYKHDEGRCAITGGFVYHGELLPKWQGVYVYGDWCSGEIFGLYKESSNQWASRLLYEMDMRITSFGLDEKGELYVVGTRLGGGLFKLVRK